MAIEICVLDVMGYRQVTDGIGEKPHEGLLDRCSRLVCHISRLQESRARNEAAGTPSADLYHVMANHSIELIDEDEARHTSYAQTVRAAEGGQFLVGFMGRYEDVIVKRDGRWQIQSRKLVSFVR